jgi:hypothetical protein
MVKAAPSSVGAAASEVLAGADGASAAWVFVSAAEIEVGLPCAELEKNGMVRVSSSLAPQMLIGSCMTFTIARAIPAAATTAPTTPAVVLRLGRPIPSRGGGAINFGMSPAQIPRLMSS